MQFVRISAALFLTTSKLWLSSLLVFWLAPCFKIFASSSINFASINLQKKSCFASVCICFELLHISSKKLVTPKTSLLYKFFIIFSVLPLSEKIKFNISWQFPVMVYQLKYYPENTFNSIRIVPSSIQRAAAVSFKNIIRKFKWILCIIPSSSIFAVFTNLAFPFKKPLYLYSGLVILISGSSTLNKEGICYIQETQMF